MDPQIQALAMQLADVTVRNTAGAIGDRIHAAKARKKDQDTIGELEQIISELITDKAEVTRVAQAFEETLVAQRISDAEVDFITQTIVPVIKQLVEVTSDPGAAGSQAQKVIDLVEPLLSAKTVTVLQLLGFNFKRAIGEPLTELVSRAILAKSPTDAALGNELQRLNAQREVAFLEVAKDPDAYERLGKMTGR